MLSFVYIFNVANVCYYIFILQFKYPMMCLTIQDQWNIDGKITHTDIWVRIFGNDDLSGWNIAYTIIV